MWIDAKVFIWILLWGRGYLSYKNRVDVFANINLKEGYPLFSSEKSFSYVIEPRQAI